MKLLVVAMFMMAGLAAPALGGDGPEMTVVAQGSEIFKVVYKGSTGKVKMTILNSRGRAIHAAFLSGEDGFICPVNFKGLPSGKYTIELVDENKSLQQVVHYTSVHDRKSIHVAKVKSDGERILLAVSNAQDEVIMIRIYDQHRKLIHFESQRLKGDFAQVFRMPRGLSHYTVEVSDAGGNNKWFQF